MKFNDVFSLIGSKCGVISIDSPSIEEANVLESITQQAEEQQYEVLFWSFGRPVRRVLLCKDEDGDVVGGIEFNKKEVFKPQNVFTPTQETCAVLKWFYWEYRADDEENVRSILVIADVHKIASDSSQDVPVNRLVKDIAIEIENSPNRKRIIMLGSGISLALSLSNLVEEIRCELPNEDEIKLRIDEMIETIPDIYPDIEVSLNDQEHTSLIRSLQGMTIQEIVRNFRLAMKQCSGVNSEFIDFMQNRKIEKFQKLGVEFSPTPDVLVAGLDLWQEWVQRNYEFFSEDAKRFGLKPPKGVVLVGVPGTGKSLTAKSIGYSWRIPVLSLNISAALSSYVGQSEERFRQILKMAEAVAPAILFIDELEKAFAGVGAGALDAGVMDRIFGTFLSWLNDKTAPVFVIAAANKVEGLPPEFLRKGRFDEIFFVNLPNLEERRAIIKAHCNNKKVKIADSVIDELASMTDGYNGAEIASLINEAQKNSYFENKNEPGDYLPLRIQYFQEPIKTIKPISQTNSKEINAIVEWGKANARPASSDGKKTTPSTRGRKGGLSGVDVNNN